MTNNIFGMNIMRPKGRKNVALFLNIWLEWENNADANGKINGFAASGANAMNGGKMTWTRITNQISTTPAETELYVGFSDADTCPTATENWNVGNYENVYYKLDWFGKDNQTWGDAVHGAGCEFDNFYGAEGGLGYHEWGNKVLTMTISAKAKWVCMGTKDDKLAFGKVTKRMGKLISE